MEPLIIGLPIVPNRNVDTSMEMGWFVRSGSKLEGNVETCLEVGWKVVSGRMELGRGRRVLYAGSSYILLCKLTKD
jgi:hypothetical protein